MTALPSFLYCTTVRRIPFIEDSTPLAVKVLCLESLSCILHMKIKNISTAAISACLYEALQYWMHFECTLEACKLFEIQPSITYSV